MKIALETRFFQYHFALSSITILTDTKVFRKSVITCKWYSIRIMLIIWYFIF